MVFLEHSILFPSIKNDFSVEITERWYMIEFDSNSKIGLINFYL